MDTSRLASSELMDVNRHLIQASKINLFSEGNDGGLQDIESIINSFSAASVAEITENELIIDFISAQGSLFESLMVDDRILSFQLHFVKDGRTYHSDFVKAIDVRKPIVFNYSVNVKDENYDQFESTKPRPCILIYISCHYRLINSSSSKENIGGVGTSNLVAQATVDYSIQQLFAGDFISIELTPCLVDYIYATGDSPCTLFVRFRTPVNIPMDSPKRQMLENSMKIHQRTITNIGRDILQQLKAWWANLRQDYQFISERQLKFVTEDECGRHRFVGNFISAILPAREINGPRYAARFVSLLPFRREISLSGGRINRWHSPFATLCRLEGDVEDHAILLCSLLLGWGLQAFVALGTLHTTKEEKHTHCWVVTICETGRVSFWESLTAEVIDVDSPGIKDSHYREVWALFRNDEYYVNIQLDCNCFSTSFDIRNAKFWRSFHLPSEAAMILRHPGSSFALCDGENLQSVVAMEQSLEQEIIEWLRFERQQSGLQTIIDDTLSAILHPTLASYELNRATGSSFGNFEFQSAIRNIVRRGEYFKAYPSCFNHTDIRAIQHALLKAKASRDILYAKSRSVGKGMAYIPQPARFGVRVRIFPYPRNVRAVWVVIAACQQGNDDTLV